MHIGHTIIQGQDSQTTKLFSPWFPREADNAVFSYEQIQLENTSFEVTVFEKNTEDTGDGSQNSSGSFTQVGSTGVFTGRFTALKELVRFKYVASTGDWTSAAIPCFVIYRMLAPTWYNTITA